MTRRSILAALTALLLHCPDAAEAQAIAGVEFAAAVNDVGRNTKAEGLLFVPEGVTKIAGVVVVLDYGNLAAQLYGDDELRRVLQQHNCAAAFVRLTNIKPTAPDQPITAQLLRNAAAGGGDALQSLMRQLANESGHAELRAGPLLFWGFSAAASFGTTFAAIHPERTLAFIRYHTQRRGLSQDLKPLGQIPALLIAGGKDETAGVQDAESFWKSGRSINAPWAFVVEPDSPHSSPDIHGITAKVLTIPWIAGVLQQRLTQTGGIRSVTNDEAWLTDNGTAASYKSYPNARDGANWLPDEQAARGWQAVAQPAVRMKAPDPISGTWTGTVIAGTNRIPMSIEMKFDGQSTYATINVGGVVGETRAAKFDPTIGQFLIELDAKPTANPRALASHWTIDGVEFEGTATGHIGAVNETTTLTGHFLITRK